MSHPIARSLRVAGFAALLGASTATSAVPPEVECQCRDPDGQRRDLGTVQCVDISGTAWLVRCEMSTNTPYWRRVRDDSGCPLALAR